MFHVSESAVYSLQYRYMYMAVCTSSYITFTCTTTVASCHMVAPPGSDPGTFGRTSDQAASVASVVAEVAAKETGTIGQAGERSKDMLLPLLLVNPRSSPACLVSEVARCEHPSTLPGITSNHYGC